MVEMHEARPGAGAGEQGTVAAKFINVTGALVSLALIGGIAVWGYQTIMRDVSGIPVVQALDSPMRETPYAPGGRAAENQGLSVNAVAGSGGVAPPADRVILAPPPLELSLEDALPAGGRATVSGADRAQEAGLHLAVAREGLEPAAAAPAGTGLGRSLRPRPRPDTLDPVAFAIASVTGARAKAVEPDSLPPGTHMAQIGALDSDEMARAEWTRLSRRLGDLLDGKRPVVEKAETGARAFYRLRAAGFADQADTRRFCSALQAEGADCIPVVTR